MPFNLKSDLHPTIGATIATLLWIPYLGIATALGQVSPLQLSTAEPDSSLGVDEQLWGHNGFDRDWSVLMQSVNHSLSYLRSSKAIEDYKTLAPHLAPLGIDRDRVLRSVQRFRHLLLTAPSPQALQRQIQAEFDFYQSTGTDGQGRVHFTAYFEPTYAASRQPSAAYPYPLYRRPPDLETWPTPHPPRLALEGANGLQGAQGPLDGLELVWLADRLEAYLIQVQGSARLHLTDGSVMGVGYDGRTDYPYRSIGRALVEDGHFSAEELTLPKVIAYFRQHPEDLDRYIPQNDRFIFFKETTGTPATGSIGVPVLPERSIATDKSLMPPGALVLMHLELPYPAETPGEYQFRQISRYALNQDTGGAIQGPGRADIFLGTGTIAGERAGRVNSNGQLYYLLLK
jgi:membrane-bound lytic murein transglycosylase A